MRKRKRRPVLLLLLRYPGRPSQLFPSRSHPSLISCAKSDATAETCCSGFRCLWVMVPDVSDDSGAFILQGWGFQGEWSQQHCGTPEGVSRAADCLPVVKMCRYEWAYFVWTYLEYSLERSTSSIRSITVNETNIRTYVAASCKLRYDRR